MNINYQMTPPCIIAVSGGRTSGFMLRQILDAHGGKLPDGVHAVFANTGLEHESTLRFLREIERRWDCPITWVQYRYEPPEKRRFVECQVVESTPNYLPDAIVEKLQRLGEEDQNALIPLKGRHTYDVVDFCSAARRGEPFAQLIKAKSMLPNPVMRFCTGELKIRTSNRWAADQGYESWQRAVGLRWDEPNRVRKLKGDISAEEVITPMYDAKHTLADVAAFWKAQDFDLELPGDDPAFGNCMGCFLKKKVRLAKVIRTSPDTASWWIEQEERTDIAADGNGQTFRIDRPTYRQLRDQVLNQGQLFDDAIEDDTLPCNCTD